MSEPSPTGTGHRAADAPPDPPDDLLDVGGRRSRPPVLAAVLALLCVLGVAAGALAFWRSDGGEDRADAVTEVTFSPEGNATSIPERPGTYGPIMQLNVDAGPPGSEVILQGANFDPEYRTVELYWDTIDGLRLGTVDAPRFSVKVKIPEDAPVVNEGHFIIAVQRNKDGKMAVQQSAQFYVLPTR